MLTVRKSHERGYANHSWLESYHSFSFASYYDQAYVHFRKLRVINEDWIQPGQGFGTHPHDNMEIISYVVEGALKHQDSLGNGSVIRKGEVQRMTAGTGVTHSEYNHSDSESVHLLQIWIYPDTQGLQPSYEQKSYAEKLCPNQLCLLATPESREDTVLIHQDVKLFTCLLEQNESVTYSIAEQRHVWLQIIKGEITLNHNTSLVTGDGCAISEESALLLKALEETEFLLFDLA